MRLSQIHNLVGEDQPNRNLRIGVKEVMNDRRYVHLAKHNWRSDQKLTAWRTIFAGCCPLGLG
ncbi:hypothetical protein MPLA_770031 [Mesorhizobium sp. ORS 3359]|nr:hypothetical protein MPLA_770031 [Mesorhizobium sp. ORS 3359]